MPSVVAPSFDIVRVGPGGDAVLAGRAPPGSQVEITDNGKPLARTQADDQGQWVALPAAPLSPGGQQLTVAATPPAGPGAATNRREGAVPVIIIVPQPRPAAAASAPPPATALALLAPPTGMPRLLQAPAPRDAGPPAKVGLDIVDYDDRGAIRFAGRAPPRAVVRLYVDDRPAGEVTADAYGRWLLAPLIAIATGTHRVRVDLVGIHGEVEARIELPFDRATLSARDFSGGSLVVVQPRQSLWRIARISYGHGVQYMVIYEANREQIRDPRLIYPGQILSVPASVPAAAAGH